MRNLWITIWVWFQIMRGKSESEAAIAAMRKFFPHLDTPAHIRALKRRYR
jgi:hypothetical protein